MRIIQISGWSGSGKTTFIQELIVVLCRLGAVGTIKHIGDHVCDLPAGKDTTLHYLAGASVSVGIDLEKSLISRNSLSLFDALDMLADAGIEYVVVEGFKQVPFKKAVLGDLDLPCLIRNPSVEDVLNRLEEFDEYFTPGSLIRTAQKSQSHSGNTPGNQLGDDVILTCSHWYGTGISSVDSDDSGQSETFMAQIIDAARIIMREGAAMPGHLALQICPKCRVHTLPVPVYTVVTGPCDLASPVLAFCMKRLSHFCGSEALVLPSRPL